MNLQYSVCALLILALMLTFFFYVLPQLLCRKQSEARSNTVNIVTTDGCFNISRAQFADMLVGIGKIIENMRKNAPISFPERQKNETASIEDNESELKYAAMIRYLKGAIRDVDCGEYIELEREANLAVLSPNKFELDHIDVQDISSTRILELLVELSTALHKIRDYMLVPSAKRYFVDIRNLERSIELGLGRGL